MGKKNELIYIRTGTSNIRSSTLVCLLINSKNNIAHLDEKIKFMKGIKKMSYAIIRNEKKKITDLAGLFKHNHRRYKNHSNKEIDEERTKDNYSIKYCPTTYTTELYKLIQEYNLLGTTKMIKKNRVVACEQIITSDKEFFEKLSLEEEKRFFEESYKFVATYKDIGELFILDAVIHKDEGTPHMHIVFVPIIRSKDDRENEVIKLDAGAFWKGKDSYRKLQDSYYSHMIRAGFDLERGNENSEIKHQSLEEFKKNTHYRAQEITRDFQEVIPIKSNNVKKLKIENLKLFTDYNYLATKFKCLDQDVNTFVKQQKRILNSKDKEIKLLKQNLNDEITKNEELEEENFGLKSFIDKSLRFIEKQFEIPKSLFVSMVNSFELKIEEIFNFNNEKGKNNNGKQR